MNPDPAAWILKSRRVATPQGVRPASVRVQDGLIAAIEDPQINHQGLPVLDVGEAVVMPGVVDSHVHVNEPGRTEWEGFETATRAAAAGGVTTICDMPLNSIPVTTTPDAVEAKSRAAAGQAHVDYAFWGGVIPANADELLPLLQTGLPGCKCFLVHSGIDEFPNVVEQDLLIAMPALARSGAVLLVHAELPGPIDEASHGHGDGVRDPRKYTTWLSSRPRESEDQAIALMIRLAERTGCRVHIVHLSSSNALPAIREARARGVPLTVETCPHYLTFVAEDIGDGHTEYKCAPPIRERANREALWSGLATGTIDMVVSDHSPCTPELKTLKTGDYTAAWGGISSLQLALPALWTEAHRRGFGLSDVAKWMCERPALLAGLSDRKGTLAPGQDADLIVWYPEREFRVDSEILRHRHPVTPYLGRVLKGVVGKTFLRGTLVFDEGRFPIPPTGRRLLPKAGA